jgi:hypothetical protein
MAKNDEPLEPAAEDGWVQDHLDTTWRASMAATREAMESLRRVVPEMTHHLPEAGYVRLEAALRGSERAYADLHEAGPHVIGQGAYDRYLEAQTARTIGG